MIDINKCLTVHANLSLVFEVTFVACDDNRERAQAFGTEDFLVERAYLLERAAGCDGVDEEESLACAHELFAQSRRGVPIFFLTWHVHNIEQHHFVINHTLLSERI